MRYSISELEFRVRIVEEISRGLIASQITALADCMVLQDLANRPMRAL